MLELVKAGGWLMLPILLCSVAAMAIVVERFWTLQRERVAPENLVVGVWQWVRDGKLDEDNIRTLRQSSPLGRILAAALMKRHRSREVMKESIEEVGRHVGKRDVALQARNGHGRRALLVDRGEVCGRRHRIRLSR